MQRDLGGPARPKPAEIMGPLPVKTEGMLKLLIDRLDALADSGEPTSPRLGPRGLPLALRGTEDVGTLAVLPSRMVDGALKALLDPIRPHSGGANARQGGGRVAAEGEEGSLNL